MYAVNGVNLINPTMGWTLLRESIPVSALEFTAHNYELPGRDGIRTLPSTRRATTINLTIKSTLDKRDLLLGLMSSRTLEITHEDRPGWVATGHILTSTVERYHGAKGYSVDTFVIEIPSGSWRASTDTTTPLTAPVPTAAVLNLYPGLTAPVQDAVVRVKGPITDPQVMDSSGAFIALDGSLGASDYLRFESTTGRAYITNTDTWTGGSEVSSIVDYGGPRGVFEITPFLPTPSDPSERTGRLSLTQFSYSAGSGFQVRGRSAHLL